MYKFIALTLLILILSACGSGGTENAGEPTRVDGIYKLQAYVTDGDCEMTSSIAQIRVEKSVITGIYENHRITGMTERSTGFGSIDLGAERYIDFDLRFSSTLLKGTWENSSLQCRGTLEEVDYTPLAL